MLDPIKEKLTVAQLICIELHNSADHIAEKPRTSFGWRKKERIENRKKDCKCYQNFFRKWPSSCQLCKIRNPFCLITAKRKTETLEVEETITVAQVIGTV